MRNHSLVCNVECANVCFQEVRSQEGKCLIQNWVATLLVDCFVSALTCYTNHEVPDYTGIEVGSEAGSRPGIKHRSWRGSFKVFFPAGCIYTMYIPYISRIHSTYTYNYSNAQLGRTFWVVKECAAGGNSGNVSAQRAEMTLKFRTGGKSRRNSISTQSNRLITA